MLLNSEDVLPLSSNASLSANPVDYEELKRLYDKCSLLLTDTSRKAELLDVENKSLKEQLQTLTNLHDQ